MDGTRQDFKNMTINTVLNDVEQKVACLVSACRVILLTMVISLGE